MISFIIIIVFATIHLINGNPLTCDDQPKDIVFILDSSGSISEHDFNYAKYAMIKALHMLKVSKDHTRVAFEHFGTDAVLQFNLDTFDNINLMANDIKTAKYSHGLTAIGKALKLAVEKVLPKMRNGVTKLVILFTDGANNVYPAPQIYADHLKTEGVRIICVGIGSEINKGELQRIASEKSVLFMHSFKNLVQNIKKVSDHLCNRPDPQPVKPCTVPQQDLVFLIDSSDSLTQEDFEKSKEFMKTIIKNVKLGSDTTRIGMISFSDTARLNFNIDSFTEEKEYLRAIDNVKKVGTVTAMGEALNMVLLSVWPKHRDLIPFNIIVVTDGVNNKFPKPEVPATDLKKKGANIISVGIGKDINFNELIALSSNNKIITIRDYSQLLTGVKSVEKMITCG